MIMFESILKEAKDFINNDIRPFASEFDQKEQIPRSVIDKLALKGYLSAPFPKKYGGLELDPLEYGQLTEQIGMGCSSVRAFLTVHTSLVGETILRWGSEDQKDLWLPEMALGNKLGAFALSEPDVGSDAKNITTTYQRNNGKYIINGKKKWITLGYIADFFIVVAKNNKQISTFIVESNSKGIKRTKINGLLGSKACYIAEIEFNNVEVPIDNILGKEGSGFTYIVNSALDSGRYSISWGGLALAQEALNVMVNYSRNRKQFGEYIYKFQLIQGMIGDSVTKIHALRALCQNAGKLRKENSIESVTETTIAKYFASKVAVQVSNDTVQVLGGNGVHNNYPAERLYREAKILEIIEGTSQIQQEIISFYGLRKYYKK